MEILQEYLDRNGYTIIIGDEATDIFMSNKKKFEKICGETIFDGLEAFIGTEGPDIIKLLILNNSGIPVSVFYGTIEDGHLSSDFTCSSELPKGGILLRFYALLLVNENNPGVTSLTGGISGGIPALNLEDSREEHNEKRKKLRKYHIDNGASVEDDKFTYNLPSVQAKIAEIFGGGGGKKRNKSKRKRNKSKRKRTRRYKQLK
jgi:hypothetical protein